MSKRERCNDCSRYLKQCRCEDADGLEAVDVSFDASRLTHECDVYLRRLRIYTPAQLIELADRP